jgi:CO/xanthine dehydrogenase FAD-binding subunit
VGAGPSRTRLRGQRPPSLLTTSALLHRPQSVAEALSAIEASPDFTVCAGGTALMARANLDPAASPTGWIFLHGIAELHRCDQLGDGRWRLGSLVTLERLASLHDVAILAKAAGQAGSWQLRNTATLGGNLVAAWATSDLIPVLQCLDADVETASPRGVRRQAIGDFLLGPEQTTLRHDEIVTAVVLPPLADHHRYVYERISRRAAMSPLICALAICGDPTSEAARVVVADGSRLARRAPGAERWLWTPGVAQEFVAATLHDTHPVDDELATAAYRHHALGVLAQRAYADITGIGVGR